MNEEKSEITIVQTVQTYIARVRAFRPNARLYLLYMLGMGIGMGVFRLLFNFFVLSLGYNEALLGSLITTNNMTSLIVALPMGYLADRLGRRKSLMLSALFYGSGILTMVLWPGIILFFMMNMVIGLAQSLWTITQSPFLMENSGDEERTYLFSLSFGMRMAAVFVGNWIGGYLPSWFGAWQGIEATSSTAYGWALGGITLVTLAALLPIIGMRKSSRLDEPEERSLFLPITYFRDHRKTFSKLVLPIFITSFGAGLIIPFMNVFYRTVHNQPDQSVGTLFAWGSLSMGVGLILAPAVADRFGKIQLVVITQALSIPFLFLLGFSPWYWVSALAYLVRHMLMNMSNPVYQTFVMERVEPEARATAASLVTMAWSFGRAFSPTISGYIQVAFGFGPTFIGTIVLYLAAIYFYWRFFWVESAKEATQSHPSVPMIQKTRTNEAGDR